MIPVQRKRWFVAALVVSLALGAGIAYGLPPAHEAPTSTNTTNDESSHGMTPEAQCQHMPEMCPPPGGSPIAPG